MKHTCTNCYAEGMSTHRNDYGALLKYCEYCGFIPTSQPRETTPRVVVDALSLDYKTLQRHYDRA